MKNLLKRWVERLLGQRGEEALPPADERILALEREAQRLRLELEEAQRRVEVLKGDLERQRRSEEQRLGDIVQAKIERLFSDVAAPVAQLLTQAYLVEVEGKPVQAKDVIVVAKRLVRVLEDNGLALEGKVGEIVPFEPNRHEPLSADASLKPGEQVLIRFVGVSYGGKVLKKAGVVRSDRDRHPAA